MSGITKRFPCEFCDFSTDKRFNYKRHLDCKHRDQVDKGVEKPPTNVEAMDISSRVYSDISPGDSAPVGPTSVPPAPSSLLDSINPPPAFSHELRMPHTPAPAPCDATRVKQVTLTSAYNLGSKCNCTTSRAVLFCACLGGARPIPASSFAIPCTHAFDVLSRHPSYSDCGVEPLIAILESSNKMVGVASLESALQMLDTL